MFYDDLCSQVSKGYLYLSRESQQFLVADQRHSMHQTGKYWDLHFRMDASQHHQLSLFIDECAELQKSLHPGEERRVQLIYRIGIHTLTIDFKITSQSMACFVVDAVNSSWVEGIAKLLSQSSLFDRVYVALPSEYGNTPQAIDGNCHFFAMEHAKSLLEMDPYPLLAQKSIKKGDMHVIYWESLPVQLIKDAETRAFLENYLTSNPNALQEMIGLETFEDYYLSRSDPKQTDIDQYPHFPHRSFSIEMHAIQYFHDLNARIKSESEQAILMACQPWRIQSNTTWRQEKENMPIVPAKRVQLTFDEAMVNYKDPYGSVPGLN